MYYVSLHELSISGKILNDWPNFIVTENLPGSLQWCARCDILCNVTYFAVEKADAYLLSLS